MSGRKLLDPTTYFQSVYLVRRPYHLDHQRIFRSVADFFEHAFRKQQDGQCMCNVRLRRFRATIVVVEKQSVLHIP